MVDVRLLGQFDIAVGGASIRLGSSPAERLVAFLALTKGTSHRREHLAALLWPDSDEPNARQNLRNALYKVNLKIGAGIVQADKTTVGIAPSAALVSDVERLETADDQDVDALADAIDHTRGELLPGFFDEWVLRERERIHAIYDRKLDALLEGLQRQQRWPECIHWAERWIATGRVPEAAYRALMHAHLGRGDFAAAMDVFERLSVVLRQEYGIEPSPESLALHEAMRAKFTSRNAARPSIAEREAFPPRDQQRTPPSFPPQASPGPFWGREGELSHLAASYRRAAQGDTRVVLVSGEAGQGKSRLLDTFARQLLSSEPMPLVTMGKCSTFGGIGEPYMPFREIFNQLLGDVESAVRERALPAEHGLRLWHSAPALLEIAREVGITRLRPLFHDALIPALSSSPNPFTGTQSEAGPRIPADDGQLFGGLTEFLAAASHHAPLVLIFDDLHWVDVASASLLFHLARRMTGSRVMIVGAYRDEEVTAIHHPLAPIIGELERLYGDVRLDLAPHDGGRAFVDAALDHEANRLGQEFRSALTALTRGNGLFTVELLEEMRARGGLIRGDDGVWQEGADLDWATMPSRIEGIIRTRVGRLPPATRELLEIGSVIGERFEADVVASVANLPIRAILTALRETSTSHLMIEPAGMTRNPRGRISHFQFRHNLFQRYLYGSLDESDRLRLHEEVGSALESLYANTPTPILPRLARHFHNAAIPEKAGEYLCQAGHGAIQMGAYPDAERLIRSSLDWIQQLTDMHHRLPLELKATLALGHALQATRGYASHEVNIVYERARELATISNDTESRFRATWSIWAYHMQHAHIDHARELANDMQAMSSKADPNPEHALQAHHALWFTALCEGRFTEALEHTERGMALESAAVSTNASFEYGGHDPGVCARLFAARALWFLGREAQARLALSEALGFAERTQHPNTLAHAHVFAAEVHVLCRDHASAIEHAIHARRLAEKHGLGHWRIYATILLGCALVETRDVDAGIATLREGLESYRANGGEVELPVFLGRLADAHLAAGHADEARRVLLEATARSSRTGERRWDAELHRLSAMLATFDAEPWPTVEAHFERAIDTALAQQSPPLALRAAIAMRNAAPDDAEHSRIDQRISDLQATLQNASELRFTHDAAPQTNVGPQRAV